MTPNAIISSFSSQAARIAHARKLIEERHARIPANECGCMDRKCVECKPEIDYAESQCEPRPRQTDQYGGMTFQQMSGEW